MYEDYITFLIDSIESYDKKYHPKYFILLYIPSSDEYDRPEDMYFAALAAKIKPTKQSIDSILLAAKAQMGNIVYAAETKILKKEDAISHLESLLD